MSIFKNFVGTMKSVFHIGGPDGNILKHLVDGIAVRNSSDTGFANLSIKAATGSVSDHGVNWLDLRDSDALMQFNFDGASAPSPGANTGTYGMCHTSGGAYTAGQIYYDDGVALRATKIPIGTKITTGTAITGTVSFVANGIYAAHSATAPFSWTLKGDGTRGDTGVSKTLKLVLDNSATKSSTFSVPAGSEILRVKTTIDTAYDAGSTIEVILDGTASLVLQPTTENLPQNVNTYISDVEDGTVTAGNEGVVTVNITGTPAAGAGSVLVEFSPSTLV